MTMTAHSIASVDDFTEARGALEVLFLQVREAGATSHVTLGAMITAGVARVSALTYQAHLDALFARELMEVRHWVRPPKSEVRARERQFETEHGRMSVSRHGLKLVEESAARFPLDEALSLPAEMYALSLREEVSLAAVEASFDRSVERVDRATAGHVPKRQVEEEVARAAADFESFYERRKSPANDALSERGLQVGSADGKGVTMRPESLRDATRKQAEADKTVAVRGDPMAPRKVRRHDKRMAVVTAVWEQERHVRTADDVLIRLKRDPKGRKRRPRPENAPRPQNKRVAASVTKSHAEGVAEMFDEMQRRNPDGAHQNVILIDGDENQLANVEAAADTRAMTITIVFDLIHVLHYLWMIAVLLCPRDRAAADAWVTHILKQLLTRHPLDVVATIRQTATNRKLSPKKRLELDGAVEYLRKNSTRIHYAKFLAEGLPIATGVIEGTCRYLIQDRLGITGARWGLAGAEAILKLRSIRVSDDWEEYWQFHLRNEHLRNYPIREYA